MGTNYEPNRLRTGYFSVDRISDEFQKIRDALGKMLNREGTGPNQLETDIDLNGYRLMNVGDASSGGDAPNLGQVSESLTNAQEAASDAELHAQSTTPFTDSNEDNFDKGAKGWAQDAEQEANDASTSANQAGTFASSADADATSAEQAKDLAERWASEDRNTIVENGLYSAFHWAQEAQDLADPGPALTQTPLNSDLRDGVEREAERGLVATTTFSREFDVYSLRLTPYVILLCSNLGGSGTRYNIAGYARGINNIFGSSGGIAGIHFNAGIDGSGNLFTSMYGNISSSDSNFSYRVVTCTYNGKDWIGLELNGNRNPGFWYFDVVYDFDSDDDVLQVVESSSVTNLSSYSNYPYGTFFGRSGDIVEQGTNSNGSYVRWESGFQVCWNTMTVNFSSGTRLTGDWTFPKSFSETPFASMNLGSAIVNVAGVSDSDLAIFYVSDITTTTAQATLVASSSIFQSGDSQGNIQIMALGLWK